MQCYGGLWSGNFYPALRELGHEIVESQTDLLPASRFMDVPGDFTSEERELRSKTTEQILREVRVAHAYRPLNLFLSYFYNSHFDPEGFDELRRMGIPSVNFYCNSMYQFDLVRGVARGADFAWHAEKGARQLYLNAGANPIWVQMAADPNLYRPIPGIPRLRKACFVGQRYCDRDRWIAKLVRSGVPVEVYGAGWKGPERETTGSDTSDFEFSYLGRSRPAPGSLQSYSSVLHQNIAFAGLCRGLLRSARQLKFRHETRSMTCSIAPAARGVAGDVAAVFAKHEVCLNFSNVWADGRPGSQLIPHVRLRDFEGPMCRTCYLTGHNDEIEEFYDIGREIDTYRSQDELVEKTRFYLDHCDAAEKLREAGYRRAVRDHTWKMRFQDLFRKTGMYGVD
jgi:spore maturation protein CgeB